jgi:hypothetical protein
MARRDALLRTIEPLLEPGEVASHAFVANVGGEGRPSRTRFQIIAVTDRAVVVCKANHNTRWQATEVIARLPRAPFDDVPPRSPFGVFSRKRWRFDGVLLWLDGPSRTEAHAANEILGPATTAPGA